MIWSVELNMYGYVANDPVNFVDTSGLSRFDRTYGLSKKFWNWYHRNEKRAGDRDLSKNDARDLHKEWNDNGRPGPDSKGKKEDGSASPDITEWLIPWPIIPSDLANSDLTPEELMRNEINPLNCN